MNRQEPPDLRRRLQESRRELAAAGSRFLPLIDQLDELERAFDVGTRDAELAALTTALDALAAFRELQPRRGGLLLGSQTPRPGPPERLAQTRLLLNELRNRMVFLSQERQS